MIFRCGSTTASWACDADLASAPLLRPSDRIVTETRAPPRSPENARLYREMVAERDKAERASRAKDELVAILGHELRNRPMVIG
jgi:hypothetical protein